MIIHILNTHIMTLIIIMIIVMILVMISDLFNGANAQWDRPQLGRGGDNSLGV